MCSLSLLSVLLGDIIRDDGWGMVDGGGGDKCYSDESRNQKPNERGADHRDETRRAMRGAARATAGTVRVRKAPLD